MKTIKVTPRILAYARGFADGQAGEDRPPYMIGSDMHAIYEQGRLDSELDGTQPCRPEPAIPITAKTKG
jgi:hypothetical protein